MENTNLVFKGENASPPVTGIARLRKYACSDMTALFETLHTS